MEKNRPKWFSSESLRPGDGGEDLTLLHDLELDGAGTGFTNDEEADTFLPEEEAEVLEQESEPDEKRFDPAAISLKEMGAVSLDNPMGDDGTSLEDFVEDKESVSPQEATLSCSLAREMERILASLDKREEGVLRMRFGIGMKQEHTLEEVGRNFEITRERVRQIEAKALRKLKCFHRAGGLRSFFDS